MRYLARIGPKQMWGKQTLTLYCKEVDKFTWVPVKGESSIEFEHKFSPGTLVIAHITVASNHLQRLEEATQQIVLTLQGFSTISRRYKDLTHDIEAWKESMQIQLEELRRREEELLQRAEELHLDLVCTIAEHSEPTIPQSLERNHDVNLESMAF
jgi:chaperonin cofactor prefoldin